MHLSCTKSLSKRATNNKENVQVWVLNRGAWTDFFRTVLHAFFCRLWMHFCCFFYFGVFFDKFRCYNMNFFLWEDFFDTNHVCHKHSQQVFSLFLPISTQIFSSLLIFKELRQLCSKFWNFLIKIYGKIRCQSWSLLIPFYNGPTVHWNQCNYVSSVRGICLNPMRVRMMMNMMVHCHHHHHYNHHHHHHHHRHHHQHHEWNVCSVGNEASN